MTHPFRAIRIAAFAGALALASFPAVAQDISDSHLKAARAAISSIKATSEFDTILPQAAAALKQELIRKDPNLENLISRTVNEKTIELASRRADLEREAALAYARVFSEEELNAIADFYTSDAGQKLIQDGPIVTREVIQAAEIWQTGIARDLAQSVGQAIAEQAPDSAAQEATPPTLDAPAAGAVTPPAEGGAVNQ
ncbi:MAG: DUF2059 domain-containing protein [Rhizobiaceae bacterium]|nr:DUF2059 domain-containing protein [Rhizobiaceae bacterium]MCV0407403.1 DUF2059 domain-containing protein [Rhizobiaceae bacterium]